MKKNKKSYARKVMAEQRSTKDRNEKVTTKLPSPPKNRKRGKSSDR